MLDSEAAVNWIGLCGKSTLKINNIKIVIKTTLFEMRYAIISCCFVCFLASGVLKGFDPLLNLVLDGTTEHLRGTVSTDFSNAVW